MHQAWKHQKRAEDTFLGKKGIQLPLDIDEELKNPTEDVGNYIWTGSTHIEHVPVSFPLGWTRLVRFPKSWVITHYVVHPEATKYLVAARMFQGIVDEARNEGVLTVEAVIHKDNRPILAHLKRLGKKRGMSEEDFLFWVDSEVGSSRFLHWPTGTFKNDDPEQSSSSACQEGN